MAAKRKVSRTKTAGERELIAAIRKRAGQLQAGMQQEAGSCISASATIALYYGRGAEKSWSSPRTSRSKMSISAATGIRRRALAIAAWRAA